MTVSDAFDLRTAGPSVQLALATYINAVVNGGYDGGTPAAEHDCRARLKRLNCDDDYIEGAITHANKLGDEGRRKKEGIE